MCGGGMYRDALMMITGATGTGKTLIGLQFMVAGIEAGERVLLPVLRGEPVAARAQRRGVGDGPQDARSAPAGCRSSPAIPRAWGSRTCWSSSSTRSRTFEPTRLVLDSITAIEHNSPAKAFREFSVGLSGYLKGRGVATMMTTTLPNLLGGDHATDLYLSTIADAILALRYFDLDSQVRRAVLVLKVRGSQHASEMHEYEILETGMSVLGPIEGVRGILAGLAQQRRSSNGGARRRRAQLE